MGKVPLGGRTCWRSGKREYRLTQITKHPRMLLGRVPVRIKKEDHVDADRYYLAPKGFLSRFAEEEVAGWTQYDEQLHEFVLKRFGGHAESKHLRHVYKGDAKIIMDRIHFDDPASALRGVLSAFRVFIEDENRHQFATVYETALDLPPGSTNTWPAVRDRILSAGTANGLEFHPECATALPVFWIVNDLPAILDLTKFVTQLERFSRAFPMVYAPEAGQESIELHGSGRYAKTGPDPRAPGGWKDCFRTR